jgi:hypothetical protein
LSQILGQAREQVPQDAGPLPLLKPTMARLVRRIPLGKIFPGGARAEHPKDAVQHLARIPPRSPAAVLPTFRFKERLDDRPLLVGQVHARPVRRDRVVCL